MATHGMCQARGGLVKEDRKCASTTDWKERTRMSGRIGGGGGGQRRTSRRSRVCQAAIKRESSFIEYEATGSGH